MTTNALVPAWTDDATLWAHAVANTQDNYLAYENLGTALYLRHDFSGALSAYTASLAAFHGRWPADQAATRVNLGLVYLAQDQPARALDEMTGATHLDPNLAEAHAGAGQALATLGRLPAALSEFASALRLAPQMVSALVGTGQVLLSESRPSDALSYLVKAVDLAPKAAQSHNALGSALALSGRTDEAITQFGQAVALDPTLVSAYCNMGIALAGQGRLDEARREADQALAVDPEYPAAQRLAASLPRTGR